VCERELHARVRPYSENDKVTLAPSVLSSSQTSRCDVDMLDVGIETISDNCVLQYCVALL
jgi:hypothetical protein